ncbi:MAG TPA: hypothetical protein VKV28_15200 [Candidatus Binataceae bacterium]|nr:hypothetical protein [Candidatus Binataceae bacterium]
MTSFRSIVNLTAALLLACVALELGGCSWFKAQSAPAPSALNQPTPQATATPPPGPGAKLNIIYTHPGDYLESMTVTKYSSATLIRTRKQSNGVISVVRFDGGEPNWQITVDLGLSGTMFGRDVKPYAPSEIIYGVLPKNFVKVLPANGDPEPLEAGRYYVFAVKRALGEPSYQAVYVTADGAIESYDAQPLIGTSFELCCSVAPDFTGNATDTGEPANDLGP